jgi:multisubunit Na+/H+ antiporter MnhB subunit
MIRYKMDVKTVIFSLIISLMINILYIWLVTRNRKVKNETAVFWLWGFIFLLSTILIFITLLIENYSNDNVEIITSSPNKMNVGVLMLSNFIVFCLLIIIEIILIYIAW